MCRSRRGVLESSKFYELMAAALACMSDMQKVPNCGGGGGRRTSPI
jgi:hypothetical protein